MEEYDLELEKVVSQVKASKAKVVLLQFPDGLKQRATQVIDFLRSKTGNRVEFLIWFGSCFGTCDTPVLGREIEKQIDLVVQFGHNEVMPEY